MGRGKIEIKKIENPTSRQVTFSKRRGGLLKKAHELAVLCDAEVALIVFSSTGKLFEFSSSGSMQDILERYSKCPDGVQTGSNSELMGHEIVKLRQQLERLQSTYRHMLGEDLSMLTVPELLQLEQQLAMGSSRVQARKNQLLLEEIEDLQRKVKADAEEWAQIQGVLKHIKDEMKTLQQNCDNWEQRALHAESKSAILQIEEEKWRVQAQLSQQKIKDLELEMAQVCARMKGLKSQFVCEQGPFLQAGGNHAYVLVLKPVLRESTSDICTCNISADFEECHECAKWCQMPLTQNRSTGKFLCNACASNAFKFDDTEQCMACGSLQRVADSQMVATPRVQSPLQKSTMEVSRENDRRGAGCSPRSQSNLSLDGPPKAKDERLLSSTSEMTISEVERSLKQKWFKQRKPSRRSNSAYSSDTSLQENNANVHVQPNSTRGRTDGRYSVKMSRPPSASNLKVSPPHLFQERLPLSEMRRNTVHER
ncbi:unnamed protein product [Sphagnum compactum]